MDRVRRVNLQVNLVNPISQISPQINLQINPINQFNHPINQISLQINLLVNLVNQINQINLVNQINLINQINQINLINQVNPINHHPQTNHPLIHPPNPTRQIPGPSSVTSDEDTTLKASPESMTLPDDSTPEPNLPSKPPKRPPRMETQK